MITERAFRRVALPYFVERKSQYAPKTVNFCLDDNGLAGSYNRLTKSTIVR